METLDLKSTVRPLVRRLREGRRRLRRSTLDYLYHRSHGLQATGILKNIEGARGKTPARDIKLCDEYAVEVLGHKHFAPWLYVYSALSGGFTEGWIPDNFYGSLVVPALKGLYGKVSSLRPLNAAFFGSTSFPDMVSYVNGIFVDANYEFVPPQAVRDLIFRDQNLVVFKLDTSLQGSGIHFFDRESFDVDKVRRLGNGLFQSYIKQHGLFSKFAERSVATLRITTVLKDDGEASARACYLRFGSGTDTHVQSKSHVRVPIDLISGAFNEAGYTTNWLESRVHPTSKVTFAGNSVPAFGDCIATVTGLHKRVPYARCIGWDVTIDTEENVRLLEWNAEHNDIKFSEATQGPCFSDLGWERLRTRGAA